MRIKGEVSLMTSTRPVSKTRNKVRRKEEDSRDSFRFLEAEREEVGGVVSEGRKSESSSSETGLQLGGG